MHASMDEYIDLRLARAIKIVSFAFREISTISFVCIYSSKANPTFCVLLRKPSADF